MPIVALARFFVLFEIFLWAIKCAVTIPAFKVEVHGFDGLLSAEGTDPVVHVWVQWGAAYGTFCDPRRTLSASEMPIWALQDF